MRHAAGNPSVITLLVSQVLHQGLHQGLTTGDQLEQFVRRLRSGEAVIGDGDPDGAERSLSAFVSHSLGSGFSAPERARLATLRVFQDVVNVLCLLMMGDVSNPDRLQELADLDEATIVDLLDRAAAVGLLTAQHRYCYAIHPALSWHLRRSYPTPANQAQRVNAAFTLAVAELGRFYWKQYQLGRAAAIQFLAAEESNLLHARELAIQAQRWHDVTGCMQGLSVLYEHVGQRATWSGLVEELVPALVDPVRGGPRAGVGETPWRILTSYRIKIAVDERDWATADALQQSTLTNDGYDPRRSQMPRTEPDDARRHQLRALAGDEHNRGRILYQQGSKECFTHFARATELFREIGDTRAEGVVAFSVGSALLAPSAFQDLDAAERSLRRALELADRSDRMTVGTIYGQLGLLIINRFDAAKRGGSSGKVLVSHLNAAIAAYTRAATLLFDAPGECAIAHHQLSNTYGRVDGMPEVALHHYQESIRLAEAAQDGYGAACTRGAVAQLLDASGR